MSFQYQIKCKDSKQYLIIKGKKVSFDINIVMDSVWRSIEGVTILGYLIVSNLEKCHIYPILEFFPTTDPK